MIKVFLCQVRCFRNAFSCQLTSVTFVLCRDVAVRIFVNVYKVSLQSSRGNCVSFVEALSQDKIFFQGRDQQQMKKNWVRKLLDVFVLFR